MNRATSLATLLLVATTLGACQEEIPRPSAPGNNLGPSGGTGNGNGNGGGVPPAPGGGAVTPPGPGGGGTPPATPGAPGAPGTTPPPAPAPARVLAFRMPPMDAVMKAAFELTVELRDSKGQLDAADGATMVTVKLASGGGQLTGTLTRAAAGGVVRFDDLEYDRWEAITLEVSASGLSAIVSPPLPVRPILRLKDPPPLQVKRMTPLGPFTVELVDGTGAPVAPRPGQKVTLEAAAGGATIEGGAERTFAAGATFARVTFMAAGNVTLVFRSEDLEPMSQAVLVFDASRTEALWLPAARVGVPYMAALPAGASGYHLTSGALPAGLTLDPARGTISGTPTQPVHARLQLASDAAGTVTVWLTDLSIFPETEMPARTLDQMNADGPFTVGSLDETVMVASRNRSEKVRVYYPQSEGQVAAGKLPVVVFHHGAANTAGAPGSEFSTIYLRFDPLLKRWASHGFVVATIDGIDTIVAGGRGTGLSLMNLTAMSENQRATIAHLRRRNDDPTFPLAGHLDGDRVVVAGHSRGGGASLITAAASPEVMAAVLLKPVDPLMSPGGETQWSRKLPAHPMLITIAGDDGDVTYPICDFLYERRSSVQSAHTIVGTVHNFSLGCTQAICGPEARARPRIAREQDWAITNAYATAFLKYVVQGDLSYAPLVFGAPGLSTGLSPLGVLVRGDRGAAALVVDDFQDSDAARNRLGQPVSATGFMEELDEPSMAGVIARLAANSQLRALYGRAANLAFSRAHRLTWTAPGATYRSELGGLDVRGRGAFVLRGRSDAGKIDPAAVTVTFTDAAGGRAALPGTGHLGANGLNARFSDLIVPVADIVRGGADPGRLAAVEIRFDAPAGTLYLDDLRFE